MEKFHYDFYFGIHTIEKAEANTKERIVFDFDNDPIEFEWKNSCKDAEKFLENNKYSLVNHVDLGFIRSLSRSKKIIVLIFMNKSNENQKEFTQTIFKKISKDHRDLVFGYIPFGEDRDVSKSCGVTSQDEVEIVFYKCETQQFYLHKKKFKWQSKEEQKEVGEELENLLEKINKIKFTTGEWMEDLLISLGLEDLVPYSQIVLIFSIFAIIVLVVSWAIIICDKEEEPKKKKKVVPKQVPEKQEEKKEDKMEEKKDEEKEKLLKKEEQGDNKQEESKKEEAKKEGKKKSKKKTENITKEKKDQ